MRSKWLLVIGVFFVMAVIVIGVSFWQARRMELTTFNRVENGYRYIEFK